MNYETTKEIELAVARYFHPTRNLVVPNVSWGMFLYELDLVVVNYKSRWACEVEIKISRGDLRRDSLKRHGHDVRLPYLENQGQPIQCLWFAMPAKMRTDRNIALVPHRAGILFIGQDGVVHIERKPIKDKEAGRWDNDLIIKLARLGNFRYWYRRWKAETPESPA